MGISWHRRTLAVAATVGVLGAAGGCGEQEPVRTTASGAAAEVPTAYDATTGIPTGFTRVPGAPAADQPLDSVSEPVRATAYETANGPVVVITGSSDSLESFQPVADTRPDPAALADGTRGLVAEDRTTRVMTLTDEDDRLDTVVIAGRRGSAADFVAAASASTASRGKAPVLAEGDLSPFGDAATGEIVTYTDGAGAIIAIRTFAEHRLEPVLAHLAPFARAVEVDGRPAYLMGAPTSGNTVLAIDGPQGGLVQVVSTDPRYGLDVLTAVAAGLEGA